MIRVFFHYLSTKPALAQAQKFYVFLLSVFLSGVVPSYALYREKRLVVSGVLTLAADEAFGRRRRRFRALGKCVSVRKEVKPSIR